MHCPACQRHQIVKNGKITLQAHSAIQKYLCQACDKQLNERPGTPMARLRTASMVMSLALNVRTEGMGVRATGVRWVKHMPRLAVGNGDWQTKQATGLRLHQKGQM
jgi:transposase-like protein